MEKFNKSNDEPLVVIHSQKHHVESESDLSNGTSGSWQIKTPEKQRAVTSEGIFKIVQFELSLSLF